MNKKIIGRTIGTIGLIWLVLNIGLPYTGLINIGCFGYDYTYELISNGIPILLIMIGFKIHK